LYNNIKPPSWLGVGTDFHLFKEGVEPKWEDPTCEHGGKWTVLVPKSPNSKQVLDTYWLNAVRFALPCPPCGALTHSRAPYTELQQPQPQRHAALGHA
jgi:translation initiation factor 4E